MDISEAKKEYAHIEKEILTIRNKMVHLPKEDIHFSTNGDYTKWKVSDGNERKTLPQCERMRAELLSERKYYKLLLRDLEQDRKVLKQFIDNARTESAVDKEISRHPQFCELISNRVTLWNEADRKWMQAAFESNQYKPEELTHKTIAGVTVRSKAEAMIVSALTRHGIAFRYESKVTVVGHTIYPDFVIIHPKTKEIIYWEHFGLWDNQDYFVKNHKRISELHEAGIMQGKNLIVTYETRDKPLTEIEIEDRIREYLL